MSPNECGVSFGSFMACVLAKSFSHLNLIQPRAGERSNFFGIIIVRDSIASSCFSANRTDKGPLKIVYVGSIMGSLSFTTQLFVTLSCFAYDPLSFYFKYNSGAIHGILF